MDKDLDIAVFYFAIHVHSISVVSTGQDNNVIDQCAFEACWKLGKRCKHSRRVEIIAPCHRKPTASLLY